MSVEIKRNIPMNESVDWAFCLCRLLLLLFSHTHFSYSNMLKNMARTEVRNLFITAVQKVLAQSLILIRGIPIWPESSLNASVHIWHDPVVSSCVSVSCLCLIRVQKRSRVACRFPAGGSWVQSSPDTPARGRCGCPMHAHEGHISKTVCYLTQNSQKY